MALDRKSIWPASVIVFALMILFPPWLYNDGYTSNQASAGYHFLFGVLLLILLMISRF